MSERSSTATKDLMVLAAAAVAFVVAVYFDVFEKFHRWAQAYERWQVDELAVVPLVLALAFGLYSWRRHGELRESERRLEHQALHDPLTDLPNRRLFVDRLGQALRRTRRRGRSVAVLFLDLDGFKNVNDSFGHEAGDRLLVAVSERLEGCLRPEDTLARFGGDELVVLLEDAEGPDEPVRVAERIARELGGPFVLGGTRCTSGRASA
jgi:GGDEF domain-containing protein